MRYRHAELGKVIRQDLLGKAGLLLVEIYGDDLEFDRCPPPHVEQQVKQRIAVLAARQADHHPVALLDHRKVGYGLAHLLEQAGFSFGLCVQIFAFPWKIIDSDTRNNV